MNVQRKPHPHSIEVILGLTETNKRSTQSFRPYCKPIDGEENSKTSDRNVNLYTRLVPRLGLVPRLPVIERNEFTSTSGILNTEQRASRSVFGDSANIKAHEEIQEYPYRKRVKTAESNISTPLDNGRMTEYQRTIEPGNEMTA